MKIVLVTGGCGCLGSWVIKLLIEKNDKVICLDTSNNINRLKLILEDDWAVKLIVDERRHLESKHICTN